MPSNKKSPIKNTARGLFLLPVVIVFTFSACRETTEGALQETIKKNSESKAHQDTRKASASQSDELTIVVSDRHMTPEERKAYPFKEGLNYTTSKLYYQDGKLKETAEWINGKRNGITVKYDSLGKGLKKLVFRNDTLISE